MPSRRDIARDWSCAKSHVDRCVKRGCPTDSLEAAREWRALNARRRAPTDKKSLARQVSEERDNDSSEARAKRKAFLEAKEDTETGTAPPLPTPPSIPPGDPLEIVRTNAQHAAHEAWRLLSEAMLDRDQKSSLAMLLAVHNKAVEGVIKAEAMIQEVLERRGTTIPLVQAEEMARKGYHVILSRLSELPQSAGPVCNRNDPAHATKILQAKCTGIIAEAQKCYLA